MAQIKAGDLFQVNTNPTVYKAIADESTRGYVRTYSPAEPKRVLRFNTNHDALTICTEEGN